MAFYLVVSSGPVSSKKQRIVFGAVRLILGEGGQAVQIHFFLLWRRSDLYFIETSHGGRVIEKINAVVIGMIAQIAQTTE